MSTLSDVPKSRSLSTEKLNYSKKRPFVEILKQVPDFIKSRFDNFEKCGNVCISAHQVNNVVVQGPSCAIIKPVFASCRFSWCPRCSKSRQYCAFIEGQDKYELSRTENGADRVFLLHLVATVAREFRNADLTTQDGKVKAAVSQLKRLVRKICKKLFGSEFYEESLIHFCSSDTSYVVSDFGKLRWFVHKHFYAIIVVPQHLKLIFRQKFEQIICEDKQFSKKYFFEGDDPEVNERRLKVQGYGMVKFHDQFRDYIFLQDRQNNEKELSVINKMQIKKEPSKTILEMVEIVSKCGKKHSEYKKKLVEFFNLWCQLGECKVPKKYTKPKDGGQLLLVVKAQDPTRDWIESAIYQAKKRLDLTDTDPHAIHFTIFNLEKIGRFTLLINHQCGNDTLLQINKVVDIHKHCMKSSFTEKSGEPFFNEFLEKIPISFLTLY